MSRKLYLDDKQVAAGQDALAPMREGASPELASFIDAVMALRRNTPKSWTYRMVTDAGDEVYDASTFAARHAFEDRVEAVVAAKLGTRLTVYLGSDSQAEMKRSADVISFALDIVVRIIRSCDGATWEDFYTGRPDRGQTVMTAQIARRRRL